MKKFPNLAAAGRELATDTDTEVVAHLLTMALDRGLTPAQAMADTLDLLEGAFAQHLPAFAADQREHRWKPVTPQRLAGTRAVVVGTGEVGRGIAAALATAGVRVTGVSRSGTRAPGFEAVKPVAELAALMPFTEWLVLAAPLTPESRGLVGPDVLARCHGLRLVNVHKGWSHCYIVCAQNGSQHGADDGGDQKSDHDRHDRHKQ